MPSCPLTPVVALAPALALLTACGVSFSADNDGWTSLTAPGVKPTLVYELKPSGTFGAVCDNPPSPTFMLMDGDYRRGVRSFTVSVDGRKRAFDAFAGGNEADPALVLLPGGASGSAEEAADQRTIEATLAGARSPIVITTDNGWTRSVPNSPRIGKFVATCHDYLRSHAAAKK